MRTEPGKLTIQADHCPVCGEPVNRRQSVKIEATVYYFGHRYYLMSRRCKGNFLRDPDRYVDHVRDPGSEPSSPGAGVQDHEC